MLLPGVVTVYGGMILFIRVWFGLVQALRHRPGAPIRALAGMLTLWILPSCSSPALSKDVYSYAARRNDEPHINPTTTVLRPSARSYVTASATCG